MRISDWSSDVCSSDLALLDEIADMLALDVCPMSWPVGMGGQYEGIYDHYTNRLMQPTGDSRIFEGKMSQFSGLNDPQLANVLSAEGVERLHEEAELAQIDYAEFDAAAYRHGALTPVYLGFAPTHIGSPERNALQS